MDKDSTPVLGILSVKNTPLFNIRLKAFYVWEIGMLTLCLAWAEIKLVSLLKIG